MNIESHSKDGYISQFKILTIDEVWTDGYVYYEEMDVGSIIISKKLLRERLAKISSICLGSVALTAHEIAVAMYTHILSHELFHFSSKNSIAIDLSLKESTTLTQTEEELVRSEEKNAEEYALKQSLAKFSPFVLAVALAQESTIRKKWNTLHGYVETRKDYHMDDEEILGSIPDADFSPEMKDVIRSLLNSET